MIEPKLHELNRDFRWDPTRGPFRIVTPEQAQSYDERGFFVLEDVFDPETIDALAAEIRASTTFDEAVSLKLPLIETGVTEVVIRVGDGNLGQSEHLLDRMLATLAGDKSGGAQ